MDEIRRWFRWFMLILVLHVTEQLLFGLDELYELSGQLRWLFGHLPNPDYGIVTMVGLVTLLVSALIYGQMTTGRARLIAPGLFGIMGIVEVHHLIKTMLHGYFPGAVTSVPFVLIGAGLLRAVIREARRDSAPAATSARVAAPASTAGRALLTVAILLGAPRIAGAQQVSYDYDSKTDFAAFHTYAWTTGHEVDDQLNHKRIVAAIDSQMALEGFRKAQPGEQPSVLVAYHASFGKNIHVTGFSSGWGGYRFAASRNVTARADEIVVGTLVVDLIEAAGKSIVWRGTASREIDPRASPEKRDRNINKAVAKLFQNYPPKK